MKQKVEDSEQTSESTVQASAVDVKEVVVETKTTEKVEEKVMSDMCHSTVKSTAFIILESDFNHTSDISRHHHFIHSAWEREDQVISDYENVDITSDFNGRFLGSLNADCGSSSRCGGNPDVDVSPFRTHMRDFLHSGIVVKKVSSGCVAQSGKKVLSGCVAQSGSGTKITLIHSQRQHFNGEEKFSC